MSWDARSVEREVTKAFRTIALTTARPTPKEFGNAWPDVRREFHDLIGRAPDKKKIRLQPSAKDISAAEAIIEIINKIDSEGLRKALYRYHFLRAVGLSKREIAKKMSLSRRTMGRDFDLYHQAIAESFSRNPILRERMNLDQVPQNHVIPRVKGELRQREKAGTTEGFMEPDCRGSIEDFGASMEGAK